MEKNTKKYPAEMVKGSSKLFLHLIYFLIENIQSTVKRIERKSKFEFNVSTFFFV
jgi:hypothetical protein